MNLMRVSRPVSSLKRILQPTSRPHVTPSSSATRREMLIAATRRGWVQPMRPRRSSPASRHIFGSCVVLPEPVSPATMSTWFVRNAATISLRRAQIGRSGG